MINELEDKVENIQNTERKFECMKNKTKRWPVRQSSKSDENWWSTDQRC